MIRISGNMRASYDPALLRIPLEVSHIERSILEELIGDFCGKVVPFSVIKNQVNPWSIFMLKGEGREEPCTFELEIGGDDFYTLKELCGSDLRLCIQDLIDFLGKVLALIYTYRFRRST